MKYTVIDIAQAKAHGIMLMPSMRQSVDGTKIVLHEEYIHNIDEFKTLPRYEYDSEEFMKLMNSKAWVHDKDYIVPDENYSRILAIREMNKEVETNINSYNLSPNGAISVKEFYPIWQEGIDVKVSERYQFEDLLWECIKEHRTQTNWKPGINTASLWKEVNVTHSGTKEDPIPYNNNMELEKNKYYVQYNIIYLCTRDTEIPVYNDLKDLVGIYVTTSF